MVAASPACTIAFPIVGAHLGRRPAWEPPPPPPPMTVAEYMRCQESVQEHDRRARTIADVQARERVLASRPVCVDPRAFPDGLQPDPPAPPSRYGPGSSVGAILGFFVGLAVDVWIVTLPLRAT